MVLDEVGRGTATWDGLAIAWAALEALHDRTRCRTIFATHFHELTALAGKLPEMTPATMRVREWKGEVVFLHAVGPGTAERSWGLHVAKLAGVPRAVLARAARSWPRWRNAPAGSTRSRMSCRCSPGRQRPAFPGPSRRSTPRWRPWRRSTPTRSPRGRRRRRFIG